MNTRIVAALLVGVFSLAASLATAQSEFPNRPIKLYVGFPPGGSTDVLARALSHEARVSLGQELLVVNKAGASGAIAVTEVAGQKADGYTIGLSPSAAFVLAFHFMKIRPDLLDVTEPLLMVGRQRLGMIVNGDSPHKTVKDLVEFAAKNPGKISIGVPGLGTSVDVFTRALLQQAKVDAIVVPFKGDSGVSTALLGGQVVAASMSAGGFLQHVQNGSMRLIASLETDRFEVAPSVPTLREMGYGVAGTAIQFLYGPKGLSPAVAKRLIGAFTKASHAQSYVKIATNNGLYDKNQLVGDELVAYLRKDRADLSALVKKLGMEKQ